MNTTTAPAATATLNRRDQLVALLERKRPALAALSPDPASINRLLRLAVVAATSSPRLAACSFASIVSAIGTLVALGLEPNTPLQLAYLIPRKVRPRNGGPPFYVCTAMIGYRGLLDLARRSGALLSVDVRPVFTGDTFTCELGLEPRVVHVPDWSRVDRTDPNALELVYAIGRLRSGAVQLEVMGRGEIAAIRARSQTEDGGAWSTDYVAMAQKSVLRRLCKTLPMSTVYSAAAALDEVSMGMAPASARPALAAEHLLELEALGAPGADEPLDLDDHPPQDDPPDVVDPETGEIGAQPPAGAPVDPSSAETAPPPAERPARARRPRRSGADPERLEAAREALVQAEAARVGRQVDPDIAQAAATLLDAIRGATSRAELKELGEQARSLADDEARRAVNAAIDARAGEFAAESESRAS